MFFLPVIAAALLRIYLINRDSIPFAYDMGRDLLWAKDISFYHIPTLIGPAASIWGVYFGPIWFYLLSVPLRFTNGNPLSALIVTNLFILLTGTLSYLLFKRVLTKFYALILAIIVLFNATLINISTFAFHANMLPLLTLLSIYYCFLAVIKNPKFLALSFFFVSLMFHADPAPAAVFSFVLLVQFIFFKFYKSKQIFKNLTFYFLAYLIPFLPQVLFELRNHFIETKSLIAYFLGQNPSLSGQLPFWSRVINRSVIYFNLIKSSFAGDKLILALLFLAFLLFGLILFVRSQKSEKMQTLFKINLVTLLVSYLVFALLVTAEVKNWYLYGVLIPLCFLITFAIIGVTKSKLVTLVFITLFLFINIIPFFTNSRITKVKKDPATLNNQINAINLIYQDATTNEFSVFVFTPSIYDLNYQYLFWWQGVRHNMGLPKDFAYLPNVPSYVRNKNVYSPVEEKSDIVYLIIENNGGNEFYSKNNWYKNFKDYNLLWQKQINGAIIVEKRIKINKV